MAYIFAADGMGLASFNFLWWTPKDASFVEQSAYRPFKVIQGRCLAAVAAVRRRRLKPAK